MGDRDKNTCKSEVGNRAAESDRPEWTVQKVA